MKRTHTRHFSSPGLWMISGLIAGCCLLPTIVMGQSDEAPSQASMSPGEEIEAEFAAWYLGTDDLADFEMDVITVEDQQPRRPMSRGRMLNDMQINELIEILGIIHPEAVTQVQAIQQRAGDRAGSLLAREFPRVLRFMDMRHRDPELYELRMADFMLNRESMQLAAAYRRAKLSGNETTVDRTREQLTDVVRKHFQLREEIRAYELEKLETRIGLLREELEARRDNADQIIRERTAELTGDLSDQW